MRYGNIERKHFEKSTANYADYLASLKQKAVIRPFDEKYLNRISQLINKTNRFNLTTLRFSRSQVEEQMKDADTLTAYVRMADRFHPKLTFHPRVTVFHGAASLDGNISISDARSSYSHEVTGFCTGSYIQLYDNLDFHIRRPGIHGVYLFSVLR